MDPRETEPVTVTAQPLQGPTYSLTTVSQVAVLSALVGAVVAGIIVPAAVTAMPDFKSQEAAQENIVRDNALLVTLGALTLWAAPGAGHAPVATDTDLNGYLQDIEVRAAQLGLVARRDVARNEHALTVSYTFEDRPSTTGIEPPTSKAAKSHPRTLQLIFQAGDAPGSLLLGQVRADGRLRTPGQVFVDLVSLGGLEPSLQPGQVLTRRGVAEIRTGVNGNQALFIDGSAVYPDRVAGPNEPVMMLRLDTVLPQSGLFADHLILVQQGPEQAPCNDRALIVNVVDMKLQSVDKPLATGALNPQLANGAVTIGPFCQTAIAQTGASAELPTASQLKPVMMRADGSQVILNARLDLASNAVTWAPMVIPAPEVPLPTETDAAPTTASAPKVEPAIAVAPWRATDANRIASPIVPGGVLVSMTCSAEGHTAIAVSGLPAPADGAAATVRFAAGGSTAAAGMRWLPEAQVYELSGRARPAETAAVVARLSASGGLTVSTGGVSKTTSAPGSNRVSALTSRCRARTEANPASKPKTTG